MCMETWKQTKNIDDLMDEIMELESIKKRIDEDYKECKKALIKEMVKKECYEFKTPKHRAKLTTYIQNRFDSKTFKQEHEKMYNTYLKESISERLTIKKLLV